jgi:hypothetical protein
MGIRIAFRTAIPVETNRTTMQGGDITTTIMMVSMAITITIMRIRCRTNSPWPLPGHAARD